MSSSHHGGGGGPQRNSEQEAVMNRFLDQLANRATREYSRGRIGATDDGSLAMAITADAAHGVVRVDFGKPVEWLGLPPEEAVGLAKLLIEKAREISKVPITIEV